MNTVKSTICDFAWLLSNYRYHSEEIRKDKVKFSFASHQIFASPSPDFISLLLEIPNEVPQNQLVDVNDCDLDRCQLSS